MAIDYRKLAVVVGGLAIVVGGGAYFYYVYQPQQENELAVAMQAAKKLPAPASALPPVNTSASAVPAISGASAPMPVAPLAAASASAVSPNMSKLEQASALNPVIEPNPEQVKPKTAVRKSAPKRRKHKTAQPSKVVSEPSVPVVSQQVTPLLPEVLPESGAAVTPALEAAPAPEPKLVTPKYNDIFTAVLRSDREAVKHLLDLGRWVDKPSASGITPLMAAVMNRDTQMVELLLDHGADPSAQALKLAKKNKDAATVLILYERGAR